MRVSMNNDLLRCIAITDDDIDWVEAILHNVKFDQRRRDIIKNMDTIDIQAFPGSGKTTVLVAKLAILAKNGLLQIVVYVCCRTLMRLVMKLREG